jgi:hypothetical protein
MNYLAGWPRTSVLLISVSQVTRITGVSHRCTAHFLFFTSLPVHVSLSYSCPFDNGPLNRCAVRAQCGLAFIPLMVSHVEHPLMGLLAVCVYLRKCLLFRSFTHFKN